MPTLTTDDGVGLYYEEAGSGTPIVFVHEFAGDVRSWEPQMRHFARRYRCITYSARGYAPSEVPAEAASYSQARARDDIRDVMDGLGIERAHVVGLSMGAFATLHFGMAYPARALSLTVAGCGSGAHPAHYRRFQDDARANATRIRAEGMPAFVAAYGPGPTRIQIREKNPRAFDEFMRQFAEHPATGSANTMEGYQGKRPSLYDLTAELQALRVPTLIVVGDEDDATLEANLLLKRCIASAGLAILPRTGHCVNLEEPAKFNALVDDFLHQVGAGRWTPRDPLAAPASIYGPAGRP